MSLPFLHHIFRYEVVFMIDKLLSNRGYWLDARDTLVGKAKLTCSDVDSINKFIMLELQDLLTSVSTRTFKWSTPKKVAISKYGTKKKRIVYLFPVKERLLLGVLYRILSDYYKDKLSANCFSYKKGVSTITAVQYIRENKLDSNLYGVKLDISSYFNSVSKERTTEMISEVFEGEQNSDVHYLIKSLYGISTVTWKASEIHEDMGLIPGTSVASFFANYCLHEIDDYFKDTEVLYARYSDDIILFADSRESVDKNLDIISCKLRNYGLSINPRKYRYFEPDDTIDFLGLKFDNNEIDISINSKNKLTGKIKHACKVGRKKVESGEDVDKVVSSIIRAFNYRLYKCYIEDKSKYGWGYYAFRYITTNKTLLDIDFYMRDRLRYVFTGKNNKANIRKAPNKKLEELGYVSLVYMYSLFKIDFDLYCNEVYRLK